LSLPLGHGKLISSARAEQGKKILLVLTTIAYFDSSLLLISLTPRAEMEPMIIIEDRQPLSIPRQKFTPDEDQLLKNLKEATSMSWKVMESRFVGRSAGTLKQRYRQHLRSKGIPQRHMKGMSSV
jgi:hypothetical protein